MKRLVILIFSFLTFFSFAMPVSAQIVRRPVETSNCVQVIRDEHNKIIDRTVTLDCAPIVFFNLIFWLLLFAGVAAIFFIIFSGIKFITSGGDPKQVEGARKTLTWALIGLVVIIMSFAIVRLVAQVTGVNCIRRIGFQVCG